MEPRSRRTSLAGLLQLRAPKQERRDGARRKGQEFAMVLMVAAVAGVLCQIAEVIIDFGRTAEWWP